MDMTALIPFVCREEGPYFCLANEVVKERYDAPMEALGLPGDDAASNARVLAWWMCRRLQRTGMAKRLPAG